MSVLEIVNLTKLYGGLRAVSDLSFTLEQGDIMGFVGPNGAGKTTTIRVAATLLEPTSGTVRVMGYDVLEQPMQVRRRIGYMPDYFGVYDDLKVWEYLDFFAGAYKMPVSGRSTAIDEVLELTDLTGKRQAYVESLSRGMKQRLCLAKTLIHNPGLLILDEPASGLDPRARVELKEILKDLGQMGKTILVSSHILPELADFCNKIAVLEAGRLVIAGDVQEITKATQKSRKFEIRLADGYDEAIETLQAIENVTSAKRLDGYIEVDYTGAEGDEFEIIQALTQTGKKVLAFIPTELDLEDIFMKVTRGTVQ